MSPNPSAKKSKPLPKKARKAPGEPPQEMAPVPVTVLSRDVDPRNDLAIVSVPDEYRDKFSFLREAALYWFGPITKVGRQGFLGSHSTEFRIMFIGTEFITVANENASLTRLIKMENIRKIYTNAERGGADSFIVLKTSTLPVYDFCLEVPTFKAKKLVQILTTLYTELTDRSVEVIEAGKYNDPSVSLQLKRPPGYVEKMLPLETKNSFFKTMEARGRAWEREKREMELQEAARQREEAARQREIDIQEKRAADMRRRARKMKEEYEREVKAEHEKELKALEKEREKKRSKAEKVRAAVAKEKEATREKKATEKEKKAPEKETESGNEQKTFQEYAEVEALPAEYSEDQMDDGFNHDDPLYKFLTSINLGHLFQFIFDMGLNPTMMAFEDLDELHETFVYGTKILDPTSKPVSLETVRSMQVRLFDGERVRSFRPGKEWKDAARERNKEFKAKRKAYRIEDEPPEFYIKDRNNVALSGWLDPNALLDAASLKDIKGELR